ncbi:MAG: hypothetical protein OEM43_06045 [Gammaproteobacteria bacterium]|nr:hypothetical protein [Gammaproteobacteria bacterium]
MDKKTAKRRSIMPRHNCYIFDQDGMTCRLSKSEVYNCIDSRREMLAISDENADFIN